MLGFEFMRNAFAAATIVAIVAGAVGYFLVLRGETFAGHALAHVGFPGATGAALIGLSPFTGLTIFTILAGLGIGLLGERAHRDVAIGMVLTLSLGLGLLFLHFYTAYASQATSLLFGNVLAIDRGTLAALAGLSAVSLVALGAIARPLLFASLQPELAEAKGLRLPLVSALFMTIAAIATAATMQIVGVLLVFALMVAPAASAMRLTRHIGTGIALAIGLALAIAWSSLILAFFTDWPTSFWITALGTLVFVASAGWKRMVSRRRSAPVSAAA
ncbi:metal ABC transporter permease [Rhizobiales bacterium Sp-1]|uniref:Metal ABC transporter permease n=1 Tax=Segnochrobactrum spirostomi TaxID=2608987 RepID=A0A6A7Y267_9HYPH|nr:metal ABC transporter permease [Segnochrobactrum spirostomi]